MKKELNKKTSELIITIDADTKKWAEEQSKAEKKLISNLSLKGFRKGKVPADIAKKNIAKSDIYAAAIEKMLNAMGDEAGKSIDKDTMILGAATYSVSEISDDKLSIKFTYPVYPEITLGDYKKLGVKYEETKAGDKIVEEEINKILEAKAEVIEKDGAIAKGDNVTFDFEGFVDGEPFAGGKAEKYELVIGSGQFIPGFEDQMIGLKNGEEKDVKVTFPKEYHSEELKGKDATFKVVVHAIKGKKLPELNDEFVKTVGAKDVNTVAELKEYVQSLFAIQFKQEARQKFQRESFDVILKDLEIPMPVSLIVKEMQATEEQFKAQLQQQGIQYEQYKKMTGMDNAKLQSQFKKQAEAKLRDAFIFAEIAKLEKIELVDADYEAEYVKLAKVYNQSVDAIRGTISKAQMQIPMTNDRVIDLLIKANA